MSYVVYIVFIIAAMVVSIVAISEMKEYKLKKEQIKADALVRTEEINSRNRLEIEQLMYKNHGHSADIKESRDSDAIGQGRSARNKTSF